MRERETRVLGHFLGSGGRRHAAMHHSAMELPIYEPPPHTHTHDDRPLSRGSAIDRDGQIRYRYALPRSNRSPHSYSSRMEGSPAGTGKQHGPPSPKATSPFSTGPDHARDQDQGTASARSIRSVFTRHTQQMGINMSNEREWQEVGAKNDDSIAVFLKRSSKGGRNPNKMPALYRWSRGQGRYPFPGRRIRVPPCTTPTSASKTTGHLPE